jgi:hypothetical protein
MSLEKIVEEALAGRPLEMKEAFEEAIQARVLAALEEKYAEMNGLDEDEDEDDMDESFDLSDLTLEELEDFMMSEDFDQLDEISKKTLASYVKKNMDSGAEPPTSLTPLRDVEKRKSEYNKRLKGFGIATDKLTGRARVNATDKRLNKEELEDFMESEDFDQLDEISKKTLASYVKKADKAANKSFSSAIKQRNRALKGDAGAEKKQMQHSRDFDKRATGLDRANARLSK